MTPFEVRKKDVCIVVVLTVFARILGAFFIYKVGFRAVSDDDFARIVLAQKFAAIPKLDPTGTSWLPLPFWVNGSAMRLFGSTIETAQILAVASSTLTTVLLAIIALYAGLSVRKTLAAIFTIIVMPWSLQLSIATVPEAPSAACAAIGAISLASQSTRIRMIGASCLCISTLSRYDAWPIAVAFSAITLFDVYCAYRTQNKIVWSLLFAALIALLGPISWTLWQWSVYANPFRYVRLVRSYRQALGNGPPIHQRILGYPSGMFEEMREVIVAFALGIFSWAWIKKFNHSRSKKATTNLNWSRPIAMALLQMVVLIVGDIRDGAPTHHPERALLGIAILLVFASADAFGSFLSTLQMAWKKTIWIGFTTLALLGWVALRLHRTLWWYASAPRTREVAAGYELQKHVPLGSRVLLDTRDLEHQAIDYGYYAVIAAFGRPFDVEIDRDQDPRKSRVVSSFETSHLLTTKIALSNVHYGFVWSVRHRRVAESIGGHIVSSEMSGVVTENDENLQQSAKNIHADDAWVLLRFH